MSVTEMKNLVKALTDDELNALKQEIKTEQANRGYSFKPGDKAKVEGLYGGTFIVDVKERRGTKFAVVLRECLVESRSRRAYVGTTWIIPPTGLTRI